MTTSDDDDTLDVVDDSVMVIDGCPTEGDGSVEDCPSLDCAKILADGHSVGDGFYWIDPQEDGSAYEVYCLMDSNYDGGGWTLISVHSDDGQDTWTWSNRHYFDTDTTTFGSLNALNEDYKSMALHDVGMQDLLFVHAPSGIWAGYNDVDNGSGDLGTKIAEVGGPNCTSHGDGYLLSTGTLTLTGQLCSTDLFFNTLDRDGGSCSNSHGSYGPTWSANQNDGCPFDDPGSVSSLGPGGAHPDNENEPGLGSSNVNQHRGVGFGWSILQNTGVTGLAENYVQVFVRRDYTDADGDGIIGSEDCDDEDDSVGVDCCTGEINPNNSHCYELFLSGTDWYTAEQECQNWGGHLVSIDSQLEQDFIDSAFANILTIDPYSSCCNGGHFWIGLRDVSSGSNNWQWSDGSTYSYSNWNSACNEPNNSSTEHCGVQYVNKLNESCSQGNWKWGDNNCLNSSHRYICEK